MDCRDARKMLSAYHDGEIPPAGRAGIEEHLRGCSDCSAFLAVLSGIDSKVKVPDPGPAYWERFNRRVVDRAGREEVGAKQPMRPERGWWRRQLPYLVPVAAAAALAVAIVRHAGLGPFSPAGSPPPREIARLDREAAPTPLPPSVAGRNEPSRPRAEKRQDRLAAREELPPPGTAPIPQEMAKSSPAGAVPAAPAAPPAAPEGAGESPRMAVDAVGKKETPSKAPLEGKAKESAARMAAPSPCEAARSLARQERFKEAEAAQRACLSQRLPPASRESGLAFLAELLDRQSRFAEADELLRDAQRRFPESRPLEDYLRVRSQVQNRQLPVVR